MYRYAYCFALAKEGGGARLRSHALTLLKHAIEWQYLTYKIAAKAAKNKDVIGHASVDYLMYAGYIHMAHHWLKMEVAAEKALAAPDRTEDDEFYRAKIATSRFYFDNILPQTQARKVSMLADTDTVMSLKKEHFSFDHAL